MEGTLTSKFEIPKDYVEKVIGAEIAKALGDPAPIIQKMVEMAMNQKKDSWASQTYFMESVQKAIQDAAKESFQEWLTENKGEVKKALKKYLSTKEGIVDGLVKNIMTAMTDKVYVTINLKGE